MAKSFPKIERGSWATRMRKWETDEQPKYKLEFDTQTGKLNAVPVHDIDTNYISIEMDNTAFFGGCFMASPGKESIIMLESSEGFIDVETMHISCQSHTYQPGNNYAGVIIYQYDGKSEWRTANNTHCKSGYIVIQDTDSENVKKWIGEEAGQVHGAVYRNAFGESLKKAKVVGEGFAYRNGKCEFEKFEINSSVFNNPKGSVYHDHRRRMHELSEHCVGKIVEHWKTNGSSYFRQSNFQVKELLEDFDTTPSHFSHCKLSDDK